MLFPKRTFAATIIVVSATCLVAAMFLAGGKGRDVVREIQTAAIKSGKSPVAHWGPDVAKYVSWSSHSNRLIPVYTYGTKGGGPGIDLASYTGENSAYRIEKALRRIYGPVPANSLNPEAEYMDQTEIAALQRVAFERGRKYVFLVIFDGMDWQTTWATAISNCSSVQYREGRGTGLHFLDYTAGGTTQFGWAVTAPHNDGTKADVDLQKVLNPGGKYPGGYNVRKGGPNPWTPGDDPFYIIAKVAGDSDQVGEHAYPDSASTATAMCSGVKTFNGSVNLDATGNAVSTVAHEAQERGLSIGVVTSVPVTHATPACAYAHNVSRDDFQDLTRDMLGLPSVFHPENPLAGVDVLIGGGFGDEKQEHKGQGRNFVPGNLWITPDDLAIVDAEKGGKYVVSMRASGTSGRKALAAAASKAAKTGHRLFGFYGNGKYKGHLPFATADGDYRPAPGKDRKAEEYSPADLEENPTLADMTSAALTVLETNPNGFWLMMEAGDVDWANHDNNLDNSIGAVNSGDAAVKVITDWVERHSNWDQSLLIVTADHGHYLVLDRPELLAGKGPVRR